ncbi:four-carbon acid sugar kinase family protein [Pseudotabrizicola formosa]|uniref:four-carbon acid sugar kinase family protein n=1 Tax=Pseudotabrizicola formosa TaxID=2030009 RepID=UPI000CD1F566|nr:four-carbon acid sugar kinase family protein [Pseudotabrizicola formosa]
MTLGPKVIVIADDLTGALDSSAAFAARGMTVVCATSTNHLDAALRSGAQVVAVSTGSRDGTQDAAVARVLQVRVALMGDPVARSAIVFKKIDSRMKGHIAAELQALCIPGQPVLICPAIPRLGRFVEDGHVTGMGVERALPVAERAGVAASAVLNAHTEAQIDAGLAAASEAALLVGAAGLADSLARRLTAGAPQAAHQRLASPALFAIGSRDPITLAQLTGFDVFPAPDGAVPPPPAASGPLMILQMQPGRSGTTPLQAAARFATGVALWVKASPPATVLACGGSTAEAVLSELGIGLLEVRGEVLPGLPLSTALTGWPGLQIITKSGGFGAPDTMSRLISGASPR